MSGLGAEDAWLRIPLADYERHMEAIGQDEALRAIFAQVYAAVSPGRLLVLGCTTGRDLARIDATVTTRAVGVDINPAYLATARQRLAAAGAGVELVQGDVLEVDLGEAFDLIHAALLFEYVEPAALLRRIESWLAPHGVCGVVTQEPSAVASPVSRTVYQSLRLLEAHLAPRTATELQADAAAAGLERTHHWSVSLPGGKSFSVSIFRRARC
jgi:SAM-dependent methyltransferase